MKKKIAVFANGWMNEYLTIVIDGMKKYMEEDNIDIFIFLNYAAYNETMENNAGEINIIRLPNLEDFDGVIVFGNIMNSEEAIELIKNRVKEVGIPAISLERDLYGMDYIGASNYPGMYELAEHLIVEHDVRNAVFLGGPRGNEESDERLRAVRDAFEKHGMELADEDIYYGDFSYVRSIEIAKQIMDNRTKRPQAIICANDYGAMGVIIALEEYKLEVPEDIIVTGFDYVNKGQIFSPSLTTVNRDWEKLGYQCMKHLIAKIRGDKIERKEMLSTSLYVGESCGCSRNHEGYEQRKRFCRNGFQNEMDNITFEWSINDMEQALADTNGLDKIYNTCATYFPKHRDLVGDNYYIIGEEEFSRGVMNNDIALRKTGYSKKMSVVLAMEHGEVKKYYDFQSNQLVPGYAPDDKSNHYFLFLPMHYRDNSFGYMIFKDNMTMLDNQLLFTWMSRVNQNLEKFRQNQKLDVLNKQLMELYTKDSLTGLYNRFGQECIGTPMFCKIRERGRNCLIMFADVNRMKNINDHYGHLQGDLALRAVANVLKESIREDWIGIRYGGDEFLIIGECENKEMADSVQARIENKLHNISSKMELPYELTVSVGYQLAEPTTKLSLIELIRKADEEMYIIKQHTYRNEMDNDKK